MKLERDTTARNVSLLFLYKKETATASYHLLISYVLIFCLFLVAFVISWIFIVFLIKQSLNQLPYDVCVIHENSPPSKRFPLWKGCLHCTLFLQKFQADSSIFLLIFPSLLYLINLIIFACLKIQYFILQHFLFLPCK